MPYEIFGGKDKMIEAKLGGLVSLIGFFYIGFPLLLTYVIMIFGFAYIDIKMEMFEKRYDARKELVKALGRIQ